MKLKTAIQKDLGLLQRHFHYDLYQFTWKSLKN